MTKDYKIKKKCISTESSYNEIKFHEPLIG